MFGKCKKHLDSVHESYLEHLFFAACFGLRMIGAGLAAISHGVCPAVFQYTGSKTIFTLHDELKARMAKPGQNDHDHG